MSSAKWTCARLARPAATAATLFLVLGFLASRAQAAERPSDKTIDFWVGNALREDPRVPAERISVATEDGVVKLTGSVRSLASRNYAEREAMKINGVRGVVDEVVVDTPSRYNFDIMQDISQRILDSSTIKSRDIEIEVSDGSVVLGGKVDSWAEVEEAELLAMETQGVRSVENRLTVDAKANRSDDEIRDDIRSALNRDIYLTGLPIEVAVSDRKVSLTGSVGSAYQKKRAEEDARWIRGVECVDDGLSVEWWENEGTRKQVAAPADDQLRRSVIDEIDQDPRVDPTMIKVTAESGHVTLAGTVPTLRQKRTVAKDAQDVVGTAWVTNMLDVADIRRSDADVQADVQFELDIDSQLDLEPITAKVRDGTVILDGRVDSVWQKFHAHDVASRVRGVRAVINDIEIHSPAKYSDASTRRRIEARLASDGETRWVADDIHVSVKDGKVLLTGVVNSWSEYEDAATVAFTTEGAWAVDNQLHVRGYDYPWIDFGYSSPLPLDPDAEIPMSVYNYFWG